MIGVISADIIGSQEHEDPKSWLEPMKSVLAELGKEGKDWEMYWGDGFQFRFREAHSAVEKYLLIKSGLRSHDGIDARIGIGIAEEDYEAKEVKFSQGDAYVHAAYALKDVRKRPCLTAFRSPFKDLDREVNLLIELVSITADDWKPGTSTVIHEYLRNPDITQVKLAKKLGIKQSTVSAHLTRSHAESVIKMESWCRSRILDVSN